MVAPSRPLIDVLAEISDWRKARGKRHPLRAVLGLVCAAVLCSYRTYSAVAQWARDDDRDLVIALGFHPSASALRGSQGQGAPDAHLLSAVSHRLGVTLAQRAVGDKTDEIPITPALLHDIILTGRVFTMDALLTQQAIAQAIIDGGGDHVMVVKENQPQLYADIDRLFAAPAAEQDTWGTARTVDKGHGRSEQRRLTASTALVGYSDWPGLAQVFELEQRVIHTRTGEITTETVYGVSPAT